MSIVHAKAIQSMINNNHRGILAMATGTGKSKVAIDYYKQLDFPTCLLVVPEKILRDENWKEEFEKWGFSDKYRIIDKICYASLSKIKGKSYELVILDEAHHLTIANSKFFARNKVNKIIGLSATPPKEMIKKMLIDSLKMKVVFEYPLEQAIDDEVVKPFNVIIVSCNLDDTKKHVEMFSTLGKTYLATEKDAYNRISASINRHPTKPSILFRMHILYNSIAKTNTALKILESIPADKKTLIFAGSKKQADILCENRYYSGISNDALTKFKEGKINRLSCVKAIDEGHNISDIETAVIVQTSSKERQLIQRIGRTLRLNDKEEPTIYMIVAKNTVDVNWIKNAISSIKKRCKVQELII